MMDGIKTSPELLAAIERARSHVMSPAEVAAQKRSWVVGQMMMSRPDMTRDEAVAIYDRVNGRG